MRCWKGSLNTYPKYFNRYANRCRIQNRKITVTKITVPINLDDPVTKPNPLKNNHELNIGNNISNVKQACLENAITQVVKYPKSLQYVRDLIDTYQDNVVLTQIGSFYELYFEQATKYAPQLNLTLTSKQYSFGRVAFAGFPTSQLGRYLKILVNDFGYSVTISDQFKEGNFEENEAPSITRKVTRIVTPGTFIDEAFENFNENTFLLNIEFPDLTLLKVSDPKLKIGLCWCDISTGEMYVQQVYLKNLTTVISRIKPKEILLDSSLENMHLDLGKWYPDLVELKKYFLKYQKKPSKHSKLENFYGLFINDKTERQLNTYFDNFTQKELAALRNILIYVTEHLPGLAINFQLPEREMLDLIMQIDPRTSSALELQTSLRDSSKKGSLLSTIKRVVTPAGSRLLTMWLSGPSLDVEEIKRRQDIVEFFYKDYIERNRVISKLKKVPDLIRLLQKFSFGQGTSFELLQVAQSVKIANELREDLLCNNFSPEMKLIFDELLQNLEFDQTLVNEVINAISIEPTVDEGDNTSKNITSDLLAITNNNETMNNNSNVKSNNSNKFNLNPESFPSIKKLYDSHERILKKKVKLQDKYRDYFGTKFGVNDVTLKLKQSNEYALYITNSNPVKLKEINQFIKDENTIFDEPLRLIQQSMSTRWISHKLWTDLGYRIEFILLKIQNEENRILDNFRKEFVKKCNKVRKIANTLAYLDVLTSFSLLAQEKGLVRPIVDNSTKLNIIGGKHVMVEDGLSTKALSIFVSNDCNLNEGKLWVITGPNMGGKSTFLRQNALIVIFAQMGSFVPCKSAHIGIVDKIFSRIGAADDLYNDMSTFMVEMIETSYILQSATTRSLAILDEIGRGTSSREGISIAYSTLKYLIKNNKCRSLFATHFGEDINNLLSRENDKTVSKNITFYKNSLLKLENGSFIYNHKLEKGICTHSDALTVAQVAGFPKDALDEARALLGDDPGDIPPK